MCVRVPRPDEFNTGSVRFPAVETVGYARALAGMEQAFSGGLNRLTQYVPSRVARTLKAGPLRNLCAISRTRFESQWNQHGLKA